MVVVIVEIVLLVPIKQIVNVNSVCFVTASYELFRDGFMPIKGREVERN